MSDVVPDSSHNAGDRPLIAVIGDTFSDSLKPLLACLNRHLTQSGFGMLYICGGPLKPSADWSDNASLPRNGIYSLTQTMPVAGYVVVSGCIGHHANARQLAYFVRQYTHRPVVCLGSAIPGIASVQVDNYTMMSRMMDYLITNRQRSRFVFIRGFPDNPRSLSQERAFRDALTHRYMSVDEELILDGNFQTSVSYQALDQLLQKRRDIDAVVAANDDMAQAAIHALSRHGLRVPEDVIVTGFYNSPAASTSLPPISTVNCSNDSMATLVTASLLSQIETGDYLCSGNNVLHPPANLVIRASTESGLDIGRHTGVSPVFDASDFRSRLLHAMSSLQTSSSVLVEDIVNDIVSMLVNDTPYNGSRLETALQRLHEEPSELYWWRNLHRQFTASLEGQGSEGQSPDALSRAARILGRIHESIWTIESSMNLICERYREYTQRFRADLMMVSTMDGLLQAMERIGDYCGSRYTFICVYKKCTSKPHAQARVLYQRPAGILGEPEDQLFASSDILPGKFLNTNLPGPMVMEPLCVGRLQLGYLILDMSDEQYRNQADMSAVCDFLANALWHILSTDQDLTV